MVSWTRLSVTLYVHCLYCYSSSRITEPCLIDVEKNPERPCDSGVGGNVSTNIVVKLSLFPCWSIQFLLFTLSVFIHKTGYKHVTCAAIATYLEVQRLHTLQRCTTYQHWWCSSVWCVLHGCYSTLEHQLQHFLDPLCLPSWQRQCSQIETCSDANIA